MFWALLTLKYIVPILLYGWLCLVLYYYLGKKEWPPTMAGEDSLAVSADPGGLLPAGMKWGVHGEAVIGRDPDCPVSIPDVFVSARHARIYRSGGGYYVEDLGSANGSLINGRALVKPEQLLPDDRLQIGRVTLALDAGLGSKLDGRRRLMALGPGLLLICGGLSLYFQKLLLLREFLLLALVGVLLTASALWLLQSRSQGSFLFLPAAALSALSLIFLYRIDPSYGLRQTYWVLIGICVFWLTQLFLRNYRRLIDYKYIFMALGVVFLLLTIVLGTTVGGSRSWLIFGPLHFEPSEFVKVFFVIFLAGYLIENREVLQQGTRKLGSFLVPDWSYLGPLLAALGLSLLLLVVQKDVGTALLYFSTFISLVYAATNRWYHLLVGILLFCCGAALMYLIFPHVQERIAVFLNPWQYADAGGYQVIQSLFALAGAGWFGWGLGSGFPSLIPAVHTDFIFSLISEEIGLIGALAILWLYLMMTWQGFRVSLQAPENFGRLLAFGFSALLSLQTMIIVGGVTGLIPLTGITLPFLSYGGSSYITNIFVISFLIRIGDHGRQAPGALQPAS